MSIGKREISTRGLWLSGVTSVLKNLTPRNSLLVSNYLRIGQSDGDLFDPGAFSANRDERNERQIYLKRYASLGEDGQAWRFPVPSDGFQTEKRFRLNKRLPKLPCLTDWALSGCPGGQTVTTVHDRLILDTLHMPSSLYFRFIVRFRHANRAIELRGELRFAGGKRNRPRQTFAQADRNPNSHAP